MAEPKQMKLKEFREAYGIPESTVVYLKHSKNFPAYKLGSRWYVDIPKYLIWREQEHAISYKYA